LKVNWGEEEEWKTKTEMVDPEMEVKIWWQKDVCNGGSQGYQKAVQPRSK
jgi:hypothetical protein